MTEVSTKAPDPMDIALGAAVRIRRRTIGMSQEALAETCHGELAKAKLVGAKPLWTRVIAEKRATIACTPGLRRPEVKASGVILAGDYLDPEYPPTLEAAVRSGVRAADEVAVAVSA